MEFVNLVREAQGYPPLERLPHPGDPDTSPLELAMGCRLDVGLMRLSSPKAADAVAEATGLPVGFDHVTIALPAALDSHASVIGAARAVHTHGMRAAKHAS